MHRYDDTNGFYGANRDENRVTDALNSTSLKPSAGTGTSGSSGTSGTGGTSGSSGTSSHK
jgi:hypothetical protein